MITAKFTKENAAKLIGTRCAMKSNPRSFLGYKRIIDTEEYLNTRGKQLLWWRHMAILW